MRILPATHREIEIFDRACVLASISTYADRVGCLIYKPNKIVCGTVNVLRNESKNPPASEAEYHAEMVALRLVKVTAKMTLYIARIDSELHILASRPCNRCMRAIKATPIEQIVYQDPFGHIVREVIAHDTV